MKDGRTRLAHKAEHAVDLETGAVVGVSVQDADAGDTQTMLDTLVVAAEQLDAVQPSGDGFAARAANACCGSAANAWSVPTRISTPPGGCAGCICADTATSSSVCWCRSAA